MTVIDMTFSQAEFACVWYSFISAV